MSFQAALIAPLLQSSNGAINRTEYLTQYPDTS
jgi:hypothetical protein